MLSKIDLIRLSRFFWALVLVSLPVTSFRFFPFLGRETMVRPLAFYPLAILILILVIRLFRRSIHVRLSGTLILLGLFLTAAFGATAWGWTFGPIPMHGQDFLGRSLRAWVTLAGGMVFFISTIFMNQNDGDLRFSIKWLYAGLLLSLVWGAIQMAAYYTGFPERLELNKIQLSFSIRKLLVKKRAAGFAYEPSWLANQLATIYLPWLAAAIFSGYRVFKKRWIEPVLLAAALLLLLATFSRGGIIMAFTALLLVFLFTQTRRLKNWLQWFINPFQNNSTTKRHLMNFALRAGILLLIAGMITGTGLILSSNKYFSQIWKSQKATLTEYAIDIYAGPRLAYASAGWEIFLDHPLTGVGLGASGLYLYDRIPDWAVTTLSEITRQLTPNAWLYPNPKNLYIRILSETGIAGFIFYVVFLLSVLALIIRFIKSDFPIQKYIGIGGLFSWFVLIFFNMTQDSFIDPNQWFSMGIFLGISAAISTKKHNKGV